jgi:hypothetical protein
MSDPKNPKDDDVVESTTTHSETKHTEHSEAGEHRVVNDDEEGTYTDVDLDPNDSGSGSGSA